ncbi:MAG: tRNA (adenosine(37)-N6)-dimethylallyltransferase MiaA [Planctomycetota bacterium]|jgi:tRNA dimethylallyltransferase|nr:tRNA (adenosine(37)-N6)-dimethylallyltransferase MiaA [Planctomycetota bacterium]
MTIPLILVLGPTASGKTALSVALAQALNGEIVNADAMAVYREMDIGTAKPSLAEQGGIKHHCLDCIPIEETCHLARWLEMAEAVIADIHQRGKQPVVAGGSPLYTKALIEGLSAGPPKDAAVRDALQARYHSEGGEALLAELAAIDPSYAADRHANDARRIIRALEVHALTGQPYSSFHTTDGIRRSEYRTLLLGLNWDRSAINQRINLRAKQMFADGLVDEVARLQDRLSKEARQAVGYKEVIAHLWGGYDEKRALELVRRNSRHLAKHQQTWYRRFTDIQWIAGDAPDRDARALELARAFLAEGL